MELKDGQTFGSLEIKKQYFDQGRYDVMGRGLYRLLLDLQEQGLLTKTIDEFDTYTTGDGETERVGFMVSFKE